MTASPGTYSGNSFTGDAAGIVIQSMTDGADTVTGTNQADIIATNGGGDTIDALDGNDSIIGGTGGDDIDGGDGTDTSVHAGTLSGHTSRCHHRWRRPVTAFTSVTQISSGDTDTLSSVEKLQFDNVTLDLTDPVQLFDAGSNLVGTFDTIQAAIDAASDGYAILVSAGTYAAFTVDESVSITGIGEVDIVGTFRTNNGIPSGTTVGDWLETATSYSGAAGNGATIAADDVTLTNLNVSGFVRGISFSNTDGLTLDGVDISDSVYGIAKINNGVATNFTMTGGSVTDSYHGLTVDAGGQTGAVFDNVVLDGVTFARLTEKGIYADHLSNAQLLDLIMTDVGEFGRGPAFGLAAQTGEFGNGIDINLKYGDFENILIDGFTFTDVGSSSHPDSVAGDFGAAIAIKARDDAPSYSSNPASLDDVTISNGTINGTSTGIRVGEPGKANAAITGVVVDNVAVTGADVATFDNVSTGTLTVTGSAASDTLLAAATTTGPISVVGGDGNDVITTGAGNDTLNGGDGDDQINGGAGTDTVLFTDAITVDDLTQVADADPITPGNQPGWTITTSEGTDNLVGVEILDGAGGNILIVGNGGFATIQAAVDAAGDGDTILVTTGTYVEQVEVDGFAGLTIMAADGATVTLRAPADVHTTAITTNDREANAVLTVENSTDVMIEGITVDGDGRGNTVDNGPVPAGAAQYFGIFYRNASGGLVDVDITGVRDPYPGGLTAGGEPVVSGVQRGVGLGVENDSLLAFSMSGGTISDFQKGATKFVAADLDISGVTIIGGGAQTIIAQNGFQAQDSTGSISGNTITGFGYTGPAVAVSSAILVFGNNDLDIIGNTITGANVDNLASKVVGIYVTDFGPPNTGGEISGNIISHTDIGIGIYDTIQPTGILVENNSITNIDFTYPGAAGVDLGPDPGLATPLDIDGSDLADTLDGGSAGDTLSGLGGDDMFTGRGGDDNLAGGAGSDTANYAGNRAGYDITVTLDGDGRAISFATVDDNNAGDGDDGDDDLTSVETLVFADMTLDLGDPVQLFDENGGLVATFTTIQAAIDAAQDDYTIMAAAGTYAEALSVNKDVTILGPNAGTPGTDSRGRGSCHRRHHLRLGGGRHARRADRAAAAPPFRARAQRSTSTRMT